MRSITTIHHRERARHGNRGTGSYYRVVLRPKNEFISFRIQDVGRPGHAERLAGQTRSGRWLTQAWLINKNDAHVERGFLVADDPNIKRILNNLSKIPRKVKGDIFQARDRRNVPEREKPTKAQVSARRKNIKKAQRARRIKRLLER